jgi:hypothetical protein
MPETATERKQAQKEIAEFNITLEPIYREDWELNTYFRRMGLRNKPGPKSE